MPHYCSRLLLAAAAWLTMGLASAEAALVTWGFDADWAIALNGANNITGEIVFDTDSALFIPLVPSLPVLGDGIVSFTFTSGGQTWTEDDATLVTMSFTPGNGGAPPPTLGAFSLTFVNDDNFTLTIGGLINGLLAVEVSRLLPLPPVSTTSVNGEFFLVAAPEPSSLMFGGVFIAGALAQIHRRMRKPSETRPTDELPPPAPA